MFISAPSIDSKFWNIEHIAVDICKAIEQHGKITIDFNTEGPAFCETNLYKLFEYLESKWNVDLSKITIITSNVVENTAQKYNVIIKPGGLYELAEMQRMSIDSYKLDDATKFGILIGRSNYPRLMLAGHVFSNLKSKSFITYHYDSDSDYHKEHLGLEQLIHRFGINSKIVQDSIGLIKSSPIREQQIPNYPISRPDCYNAVRMYNRFFVDIVCETYFTGDVFFPTEKTWRAIATKTPFVVQGPNHFLKRLRMLGFKTFDRWWDESYDEDSYDYKLEAIVRIINEIDKLDINKVYAEMESVLDHNLEVFKSLNVYKIKNLVK